MILAAGEAGLVITPGTFTAILTFVALVASAVAILRSTSMKTALAASKDSVEVLERARAIDKTEAAEKAEKIAIAQLEQDRQCAEAISNLKGQVEVLTSNTLDRLVGAATTALATAMRDVASEQMAALNKLDQKLSEGTAALGRIEAAADGVATDLADTQSRAATAAANARSPQ